MTKESPYAGRILRVDLSTGKISREEFAPELLRKYIGGSGVGTKILYDEVPPGTDPFDAENRLVLSAGPLSGTSIPGSGTVSSVTKGAVNDMLACSQANGFFGARMRLAGYEIIIIQGKSPEWKYLWIHDGEAELRSADHLLGLGTFETEKRLKKELGQKKASVACIGPSGENLVRFSSIFCDRGHVASSNGPGAVMGSKKLKAVTVFGKKTSMEGADKQKLGELARGDFTEIAENSFMGAMVSMMGTHGYFSGMYDTSCVGVKNLTTTIWPAIEECYPDNIRTKFKRRPYSCWRCTWDHTADIEVLEGPLAGYVGHEPEFEALSAWTCLQGIEDVATGIKLSALNDSLGMDTKECGFLVSMVIECYEKGVIGPKETGGLELKWGNAEAIAQLLEDIAHRRGFGEVLADGVKRAAERIGGEAPNLAVWVKGVAPHVMDPRGFWPLILGQMWGDTGSTMGGPLADEEVGNVDPIDAWDVEGIPTSGARYIGKDELKDMLGMCWFWIAGEYEVVVEAIKLATGWDVTMEELFEASHRVANLQRAFNLRHGLDPDKDDTISPRLASAPVDGEAEGVELGPVHKQARENYYRSMGWDEKTSKPLPETLRKLGLESVVQDLWG
ncbi:MAG: aldehyde ferredoxin oxidoreductase C-terminal domain-containing protein [Pseudomonadota bacterium]